MKKISMVVPVVVLVLFGSSVFAQNAPSSNNSSDNSPVAQAMTRSPYRATHSPMGMYPSIPSKEKIEKFMQSLLEMGLLYKMLEQPTMVSTDNGIIVAYGNTLRKYDKDLNVIKEVNLDVNVEGMQDLASKFAKKYSTEIMDLMGGMAGPPNASASTLTSHSTSTSIVKTATGSDKTLNDQKEEEIKKEIEQMK